MDGESAPSSKRTLRRYGYYKNPLRDVALGTAGTVDRDVEIKFHAGETSSSIDVDKKQTRQLADLYRALHTISLETSSNTDRHAEAVSSLERAPGMLADARAGTLSEAAALEQVTKFAHGWITEARARYLNS